MGAGATYMTGEQKIRPGVYVKISNNGLPPQPITPQGIGATLIRASWGPLGSEEIKKLESYESVRSTYGDDGTVDAAEEVFLGGVKRNIVYRLGSGGARAAVTITDSNTTTQDTVKIEAKYIGARGSNFKATIRDSLTNTSLRECLIYEGTTLRATFTFAKGATGDGEPAALVAAINGTSQDWVTATKLADGNKTLKAVTQQAFIGGADPATITAEDYSNAFTAIERQVWNVLAVDTDDAAIHATVQAYIDRLRNQGKRVLGTIGEPTSVSWETRLAHARAYNDPAIVYVANGFRGTDGKTREGSLAAARVAGRVAASQITESLTHDVVTGAAEIVGVLTEPEIEEALQAGCIVFTENSAGQIQIEQGINTLVTLSKDQDAGWKKIRRVKTRDEVINRCVAITDPLVGKVDNDLMGRNTILNACQGVLNRMRDGEGAIIDGTVMLNTNLPPEGDSVWFRFNILDKDSAERIYFDFGFQFSSNG